MTRFPMPVPGQHGSRIRHLLHAWRDRIEGRRALAALTDRELRDVGISPGEAITEASKPFWVP